MTLIQEIKNNNIKEVSLIASKSTISYLHSAAISSIIQGKTDSFITIHNELKTRNQPKDYYQKHLKNSLLKSVCKNKINILNFLLKDNIQNFEDEFIINLLGNSTAHYRTLKVLIEYKEHNEYVYYHLLAKMHSIYKNSNNETDTSYLKKINLIKSKISFNPQKFFDILIKDNWLVSMDYESLKFDFYYFLTNHCPDLYVFSQFDVFEGHLSSFIKPKYRKMKNIYSMQKNLKSF